MTRWHALTLLAWAAVPILLAICPGAPGLWLAALAAAAGALCQRKAEAADTPTKELDT